MCNTAACHQGARGSHAPTPTSPVARRLLAGLCGSTDGKTGPALREADGDECLAATRPHVSSPLILFEATTDVAQEETFPRPRTRSLPHKTHRVAQRNDS